MLCLPLTGKLVSPLKVNVAQPLESVGCSTIVNWLNGVPVP